MGQRAVDETIELQPKLADLERARAEREDTYDELLDAERRRIVAEVTGMLDALLTARGYASADTSRAAITWAAEHSEESGPRSITVFMPSKFEGNYLLRAQIDTEHGAAPRSRFTIDHPAFAALEADIDNDMTDTIELARPSFLDAPDPSKSPQQLDHERYHARVAQLKEDIVDAEAAIADLDARIEGFEPGQPYAFVPQSGDTIASVSGLLDAILKG